MSEDTRPGERLKKAIVEHLTHEDEHYHSSACFDLGKHLICGQPTLYEAKRRIAELEKQNAALLAENTALKSAHTHSHDCETCKGLSRDFQWLRKCGDEADAEIERQVDLREQLEAELAKAKEEIEMLQHRPPWYSDYLNLQTELQSLKDFNQKLTDENIRFEEREVTIQAEIQSTKAQIARLREALTEAQEYAEHQRQDCRELSECVCGYQAWWEKAEAALKPSASKPAG